MKNLTAKDLVDLMIKKRNNTQKYSEVLQGTGVDVLTFKKRVITDVCPKGYKDLHKGVASDEACTYISIVAEESTSKEIYNSIFTATVREIYPKYIKEILTFRCSQADIKRTMKEYNITDPLIAKALIWAAYESKWLYNIFEEVRLYTARFEQ